MSRKYFATPTVLDGEVTYAVNYFDQHTGFLPEPSISGGLSLEEARALAAQMNEQAAVDHPPAPAPARSSTWWSS